MISHTHQTLTSVTLRSATSNPFIPSSHCILELAFYIKTYTRIRPPLQQSALNTYFTSDLRSIYALGNSSQFSDSEIVTAYFALFDKLFFFSSLKESCEVNLVERTDVGLNSYTIKSLSLPNGEMQSKISIHILTDLGEWKRTERLKTYLGILLHEMIHVFLLTYSCCGGGCPDVLLGTKKLWHGDAWQDIAFAVENAVRGLLGLDVDLLRMWCVVTELCLTEEVVEGAEVERWGLRSEDIAALVRQFGERVRKEATIRFEFVGWARAWSEWLRKKERWQEIGL